MAAQLAEASGYEMAMAMVAAKLSIGEEKRLPLNL